MPRPAEHVLTDPKAWSLLIAPARLEVIEAMRVAAPCSVAEIAEIVDRPADTLYRHIDKLVKAGIVVASGTRRRGRRIEQVFDLVADDFRLGFRDGAGREANQAFAQSANALLKAAMRAVRDSARAKRLVLKHDQRNLVISYELGWLTPECFTEVRRLLLQVKALFDEGKRVRKGQLFLSAIVVTPVTRRRGSKRGDASRRTADRGAAVAARRGSAPRSSRAAAGRGGAP